MKAGDFTTSLAEQPAVPCLLCVQQRDTAGALPLRGPCRGSSVRAPQCQRRSGSRARRAWQAAVTPGPVPAGQWLSLTARPAAAPAPGSSAAASCLSLSQAASYYVLPGPPAFGPTRHRLSPQTHSNVGALCPGGPSRSTCFRQGLPGTCKQPLAYLGAFPRERPPHGRREQVGLLFHAPWTLSMRRVAWEAALP